MKAWKTANEGMPCVCPGMLIHTAGSGLWFQVTSCSVDGADLCGYYLRLTADGDGVVIIDSLTCGFKPDYYGVSELYIYERKHGLPRRDVINIMKNNEAMVNTRVYVWRNPEYFPVKKMTVAEIEKKLGYRIEIISEEE